MLAAMTLVDAHPPRRRTLCVRHAHSPHGVATTTIAFTDIVGSSQLVDRLGDAAWLAFIREHNALVREQVAIHGGTEVKTTGDGFMLAFAAPRAAVHCATAIQQAVARGRAGSAAAPLHVRIGLHAGQAHALESDLHGRDVIVAARITALAEGDEVLASGALRELLRPARDCRFGRGRELRLRGLTGHHVVHRVLVPPSGRTSAAAAAAVTR